MSFLGHPFDSFSVLTLAPDSDPESILQLFRSLGKHGASLTTVYMNQSYGYVNGLKLGNFNQAAIVYYIILDDQGRTLWRSDPNVSTRQITDLGKAMRDHAAFEEERRKIEAERQTALKELQRLEREKQEAEAVQASIDAYVREHGPMPDVEIKNTRSYEIVGYSWHTYNQGIPGVDPFQRYEADWGWVDKQYADDSKQRAWKEGFKNQTKQDPDKVFNLKDYNDSIAKMKYKLEHQLVIPTHNGRGYVTPNVAYVPRDDGTNSSLLAIDITNHAEKVAALTREMIDRDIASRSSNSMSTPVNSNSSSNVSGGTGKFVLNDLEGVPAASSLRNAKPGHHPFVSGVRANTLLTVDQLNVLGADVSNIPPGALILVTRNQYKARTGSVNISPSVLHYTVTFENVLLQ